MSFTPSLGLGGGGTTGQFIAQMEARAGMAPGSSRIPTMAALNAMNAGKPAGGGLFGNAGFASGGLPTTGGFTGGLGLTNFAGGFTGGLGLTGLTGGLGTGGLPGGNFAANAGGATAGAGGGQANLLQSILGVLVGLMGVLAGSAKQGGT